MKLLQADIRSKLVKQLVPVATFIAGGKEFPLYEVEQLKPSQKN
ncbi:MAG TPA: hypothetical protein VE860_05750 [Chthoniobacterales bacterium]|nr:hypothetical protein [Chthoniobacterales bacterium]